MYTRGLFSSFFLSPLYLPTLQVEDEEEDEEEGEEEGEEENNDSDNKEKKEEEKEDDNEAAAAATTPSSSSPSSSPSSSLPPSVPLYPGEKTTTVMKEKKEKATSPLTGLHIRRLLRCFLSQYDPAAEEDEVGREGGRKGKQEGIGGEGAGKDAVEYIGPPRSFSPFPPDRPSPLPQWQHVASVIHNVTQLQEGRDLLRRRTTNLLAALLPQVGREGGREGGSGGREGGREGGRKEGREGGREGPGGERRTC